MGLGYRIMFLTKVSRNEKYQRKMLKWEFNFRQFGVCTEHAKVQVAVV